MAVMAAPALSSFCGTYDVPVFLHLSFVDRVVADTAGIGLPVNGRWKEQEADKEAREALEPAVRGSAKTLHRHVPIG